MHIAPADETDPHTHEGSRTSSSWRGELIEDDGTVLRPGDIVTYA